MRIDTHCHIDLFDDPIATARAYESVQMSCVMTTMLPSHYQAALPHLKPFRAIRPALGMHPLRVSEGKNEIKMFVDLACSAGCIGEIGLDLSADGQKTKKMQSDILRSILPAIGNHKFVTVHSRNANNEVSSLLDEYQVGPVCFHYFIGGPHAAAGLVAKGHFFSVNSCMLRNKHRSIIDAVPRDRILVESDGPFLTKRPLAMVEHVYDELGKIWHLDKFETEELLSLNFSRCRTIVS
jgi:TatD DNase family protein